MNSILKYSLIFAILPVFSLWAESTVQTAWDNPQANMLSDSQKPGYAQLKWSQGSILPIKLRSGMVTMINMPDGEKIADGYLGSPEYFDLEIKGDGSIIITPKASNQGGADTNLVVMGQSGNKYVFYLRSEPYNSSNITHSMVDVIVDGGVPAYSLGTPSVSGSSGGGLQSIIGKSSKSSNLSGNEDYGWIKSIKVDPTEFRFDLDIFVPNPDDYVIAPERVWRDKIFTYIDFGDKVISMTQRPVVSLLIEGGETPVGFRTDGPNGRLMVIESIGDLVLRSGQRIVCIKKREKPFLIADPASVYELAEANVADRYQSSLNDVYSGNQTFQMNGYNSSASYYGQPMNVVGQPTQIMAPTMGTSNYGQVSNMNQYGVSDSKTRGAFMPNRDIPIIQTNQSGVAVELGSGTSVKELNDYWTKLLVKFSDGNQGVLAPYTDSVFFAIDEQGVADLGTTGSTAGRLYRLRVGPISSIDEAQKLCDSMTKFQGIACNVVRVQ